MTAPATSSPHGWLRSTVDAHPRGTVRVYVKDLNPCLDAIDLALDAARSALRAGVDLDPRTILACLSGATGVES